MCVCAQEWWHQNVFAHQVRVSQLQISVDKNFHTHIWNENYGGWNSSVCAENNLMASNFTLESLEALKEGECEIGF